MSGPGIVPNRAGDHREFARLYETFLDAIYGARVDTPLASGRWKLVRSLATEMRQRKARKILDCAAGTGFPGVDLAVEHPFEFEIHCTDGDPAMIEVLEGRAHELLGSADRFAPQRSARLTRPTGHDRFVIDWADLNQIDGQYDYVLCRGNSLAYADTWTGGRNVASPERLRHYLDLMASKVKPGGYLHVDAPRQLDLEPRLHQPDLSQNRTVWEEVTTEADCRQWRVAIKGQGRPTLCFQRFSSLITIHDVEIALKELRFEDTAPIELQAERPSFGVIIARKPG